MGKKFLAEVETDEYYNVEIKPLSKLDYVSKDKIRDKIKEIHDYTFMSLEERDQQDYAITKLEELLEEN